MMKAVIVLLLVVIVGSLASALIYLVKDRGRSPRTVKALTLRIGLSIGLFLLLLLAYRFGLLQPHGLRPGFDPSPGRQGTPRNPPERPQASP